MPNWAVQYAKARFSEFLDACMSEGPQVATRRGVETAVMVPIEKWRRLLAAARPSLKQLLLATVTLGEIQAGIELTREQDAGKAKEIEVWLDFVADSYNALPMDGPAFRCWAKLMHRKSDIIYEDGRIAAIAKANRLTVVTRSLADFSPFEVELLNPFEFTPKA